MTKEKFFFGENWDQAPLEDDVIEVLSDLLRSNFLTPRDVFLVSKCGGKYKEKTMSFLEMKQFFSRTGILKSNVHFVEERADKAPVCENLQINCFVDDSLTVLRHLIPVKCVQVRFWFSRPGLVGAHYMCYSSLVKKVTCWKEIGQFLMTHCG
eukprot:TRINITY_DN3539_c0_g2_i8.p1 TRINITY_DN3539_c0_g2~~TRINITY_DN3539_c0_g2_i8.p1  ORF type:complete len:153 (-),score=37.54 TRINITY_DN3539_c0_g2_i8:285-743(-)